MNKAYNDTVWSVEGVRSMEAKIKAHFVKIGKNWITEPLLLGGRARQRARGQGPTGVRGWT